MSVKTEREWYTRVSSRTTSTILVIDNFDSFTFNLVGLLRESVALLTGTSLACIPHTQPAAEADNVESIHKEIDFSAQRNAATPARKNQFFTNTFNVLRPLATVEYGGCRLEIEVCRNNGATTDDLCRLPLAGVVLSPGPGGPTDTGVSLQLLERLPPAIPVLGVCLGHQTLGYYYGAQVIRAAYPIHGHRWEVTHTNNGLFSEEIPSPMMVGRYHSLVVDLNTLPSELIADAWTSNGELMALRHQNLPRWGIQFHPESFLTPHGRHLVRAFLQKCMEYTNHTQDLSFSSRLANSSARL